MRMSELNLPTVEFKTNLTTYNMSLISNFAIIFSLNFFFWKISFIFTQRLKLVCTCTCTTIDLQVHVLVKPN